MPARRQITIEGLEVNAPIVIYNTQGRVVDRFRADAPRIEYNIGGLAEGIYWLRTKERTAIIIKTQ